MNQIASPVILDAAAVEKCCHFFDLMRLIAGCNPVRVWPCAATVSDIWASSAAYRAHPRLMIPLKGETLYCNLRFASDSRQPHSIHVSRRREAREDATLAWAVLIQMKYRRNQKHRNRR